MFGMINVDVRLFFLSFLFQNKNFSKKATSWLHKVKTQKKKIKRNSIKRENILYLWSAKSFFCNFRASAVKHIPIQGVVEGVNSFVLRQFCNFFFELFFFIDNDLKIIPRIRKFQ